MSEPDAEGSPWSHVSLRRGDPHRRSRSGTSACPRRSRRSGPRPQRGAPRLGSRRGHASSSDRGACAGRGAPRGRVAPLDPGAAVRSTSARPVTGAGPASASWCKQSPQPPVAARRLSLPHALLGGPSLPQRQGAAYRRAGRPCGAPPPRSTQPTATTSMVPPGRSTAPASDPSKQRVERPCDLVAVVIGGPCSLPPNPFTISAAQLRHWNEGLLADGRLGIRGGQAAASGTERPRRCNDLCGGGGGGGGDEQAVQDDNSSTAGRAVEVEGPDHGALGAGDAPRRHPVGLGNGVVLRDGGGVPLTPAPFPPSPRDRSSRRAACPPQPEGMVRQPAVQGRDGRSTRAGRHRPPPVGPDGARRDTARATVSRTGPGPIGQRPRAIPGGLMHLGGGAPNSGWLIQWGPCGDAGGRGHRPPARREPALRRAARPRRRGILGPSGRGGRSFRTRPRPAMPAPTSRTASGRPPCATPSTLRTGTRTTIHHAPGEDRAISLNPGFAEGRPAPCASGNRPVRGAVVARGRRTGTEVAALRWHGGRVNRGGPSPSGRAVRVPRYPSRPRAPRFQARKAPLPCPPSRAKGALAAGDPT